MRRLALLLLAALLAACAPSQASPTPPPPTATPSVTAAPSPSLTPGPSPTTGEGGQARTPAPPLPAGAVLFYEREGRSLWAAAADGGSARALTEPLRIAGGQSLLFPNIAPAQVGTPSPSARTATLTWTPSPDGRSVAVIQGETLVSAADARPTVRLLVVDTQGRTRMQISLLPDNTTGADFNTTEKRALLATLLLESPPAWSPDGSRLAIVSNHDGQPDVYIVNVADGKAARVTQDAAVELGLAWSPDGKWLAYQAVQGNTRALYAVRPDDGSKPSLLAQGVTQPYVSAGGTLTYGALWIASDTLIWPSKNPQAPGCGIALRRITLDGKDDTLVCTPLTSPTGEMPALHWNAGRKRLAFVPPQGTGPTAGAAATPFPLLTPGAPFQGYWVYNTDEKKTGQAVTTKVLSLAWPPNGALGIAYVGADGPNVTLVWRHDAADNKLLTLPADPAQADPVWAPDGKRLAFADRVVTTDGQEGTRLEGSRPAPVAWSAAGLLYTPDVGQQVSSLRLWDGANTRTAVESLLPGSARVVPPQ